jgi:hypothetical protein
MIRRRGECLIGLIAVVAATAAAQGSVSSILACRDIADEHERLACFDREAAILAPGAAAASATPPRAAAVPSASAAPASPTPPAAAPVPPPPGAPAPPAPSNADLQQQFGLSPRALEAQEVAAGVRPTRISKIEAHLVRTAHTSDGHMTFTLDNDQVWRQVEAEDMLVQPGEPVTIARGALGSYWLKMSSGRGCKVSRVR